MKSQIEPYNPEDLQNKRRAIEQKIEFNQGFERGYVEQITDPQTTLDKANNPIGNYHYNEGYKKGSEVYVEKMKTKRENRHQALEKVSHDNISDLKQRMIEDREDFHTGFKDGFSTQKNTPVLAIKEADHYRQKNTKDTYELGFTKGGDYYLSKHMNPESFELPINPAYSSMNNNVSTSLDKEAIDHRDKEFTKLTYGTYKEQYHQGFNDGKTKRLNKPAEMDRLENSYRERVKPHLSTEIYEGRPTIYEKGLVDGSIYQKEAHQREADRRRELIESYATYRPSPDSKEKSHDKGVDI